MVLPVRKCRKYCCIEGQYGLRCAPTNLQPLSTCPAIMPITMWMYLWPKSQMPSTRVTAVLSRPGDLDLGNICHELLERAMILRQTLFMRRNLTSRITASLTSFRGAHALKLLCRDQPKLSWCSCFSSFVYTPTTSTLGEEQVGRNSTLTCCSTPSVMLVNHPLAGFSLFLLDPGVVAC